MAEEIKMAWMTSNCRDRLLLEAGEMQIYGSCVRKYALEIREYANIYTLPGCRFGCQVFVRYLLSGFKNELFECSSEQVVKNSYRFRERTKFIIFKCDVRFSHDFRGWNRIGRCNTPLPIRMKATFLSHKSCPKDCNNRRLLASKENIMPI